MVLILQLLWNAQLVITVLQEPHLVINTPVRQEHTVQRLVLPHKLRVPPVLTAITASSKRRPLNQLGSLQVIMPTISTNKQYLSHITVLRRCTVLKALNLQSLVQTATGQHGKVLPSLPIVSLVQEESGANSTLCHKTFILRNSWQMMQTEDHGHLHSYKLPLTKVFLIHIMETA